MDINDIFLTFSVGQGSLKRTASMNKEQVEEDLDILEMVQDLTNKLNCMHNVRTCTVLVADIFSIVKQKIIWNPECLKWTLPYFYLVVKMGKFVKYWKIIHNLVSFGMTEFYIKLLTIKMSFKIIADSILKYVYFIFMRKFRQFTWKVKSY